MSKITTNSNWNQVEKRLYKTWNEMRLMERLAQMRDDEIAQILKNLRTRRMISRKKQKYKKRYAKNKIYSPG
jgi:RIO-like serine/threonine protein kinase